MNKQRNKQRLLTYIIVVILVLSISVGYSAFGSEMSISNIVSQVRVKSDVRVTSVVYSSNTANGMSTYDDYSISSIVAGVNLPSAESTITYKVSVTNFGNVEMGVSDITGLPENLTYSLSEYSLKEMICDDSNSCTNGSIKSFYITIGYASADAFDALMTNFDIRLNFEFKKFYMVTIDENLYSIDNGSYASGFILYGATAGENGLGNGIPAYIMEGETLSFSFPSPAPEEISVYKDNIMISSSLYTYDSGNFVLDNVDADILIGPPVMLYNLIKDATNGLDTNIDFSKVSTTSNGRGVNTLSGTENDEFPIYYYRGNIDDNYVNFGGYCWRMVRTTDTGGVKLIYYGSPSSGKCNSNSYVNSSYYNDLDIVNTFNIGYMYDDSYSSSTTKTMGSTWQDYSDLTTNSQLMTWYGIQNKTLNHYTGLATNKNCSRMYRYSSSITYNADTNMYSLGTLLSADGTKIVNGKSENTLGGYYGCMLNNAEADCNPAKQSCVGVTSCEEVDYVLKSYSLFGFNDGQTWSVPLVNGETRTAFVEVFNSVEWLYGKSASYDETTGMYTLQDTMVSIPSNWSTDRTTIINEYPYTCRSTSNTCETVDYVLSSSTYTNSADGYVFGQNMNYWTFSDGLTKEDYENAAVAAANYVYGNDISYDEATDTYTLIDTSNFSALSWKNDYSTILNNYRYTCFSDSTNCSEVNYINNGSSTTATYITLSDGAILDDVVDSVQGATVSSTIKGKVDSWYSSYLRSKESFLEDTVWCNDRSSLDLADYANKSTSANIYFGFYNRLGKSPSLECSAKDSFTVSPNNGNGKLTYPIALLTGDEVMLAGGTTSSNSSYYLYYSSSYWLMTPAYSSNSNAYNYTVYGGRIYAYSAASSKYIKPAVSLKHGLYITSGNGTASYPYTIE